MDNNQDSKLFIGGISWDTTEEGLKEYFAQIGEVVEAKIIIDRQTGRSKGFGFVTMSNPEDADRAIEELNEKELDGRSLKVSKAIPQKPRD